MVDCITVDPSPLFCPWEVLSLGSAASPTEVRRGPVEAAQVTQPELCEPEPCEPEPCEPATVPPALSPLLCVGGSLS